MASSSDTYSSALSYALELLGTPNRTLNEEQRKSLEAVYQGNIVVVWVPTGFGKSIFYQASRSSTRKGHAVAYSAIASHDHLFYV